MTERRFTLADHALLPSGEVDPDLVPPQSEMQRVLDAMTHLFAVFNGFMANGSCACVVEARDAAEAIEKARPVFEAGAGAHGARFSENLTAEPFELRKLIELG